MSGMGYQYKSIGDAIRVIIAQEGLRGLYKGIIPNLLKVAPSMACSMGLRRVRGMRGLRPLVMFSPECGAPCGRGCA